MQEQERKHVLNLAVCNRKGGIPIKEATDGNVFSYIADVSAVYTLEREAEAKINSLCKAKGFFDQSKKKFWSFLFPNDKEVYKKVNVNLYTNSIQPATIAVLNVCKELGIKVTLYHYNTKTSTYFTQMVLA